MTEVKSSLSARRVLLVDDSPVNLLVLKKHLDNLGSFVFTTASNGREALDHLQSCAAEGHAYDAVLTDVWMPEMSGDQLVGALRADARFADLPVYALTTDTEICGRCEQLGFNGYCRKPYGAEELRMLLDA